MHLADVDIVRKLAACDIVDEAVAFLGTTLGQVYLGPHAKFSLCVAKNQAKGPEKCGGPDAYSRVCRIVNGSRTINWGSPTYMSTMSCVLGIDQGEAALIAATEKYDEACIVTGDKKCLRALATDSGCSTIARRLENRVICFEQIVLGCIAKDGFSTLRNRLLAGSSCDKGLEDALSADISNQEIATISHLEMLLARLRGELAPFQLLRV